MLQEFPDKLIVRELKSFGDRATNFEDKTMKSIAELQKVFQYNEPTGNTVLSMMIVRALEEVVLHLLLLRQAHFGNEVIDECGPWKTVGTLCWRRDMCNELVDGKKGRKTIHSSKD
ncbi:hypothetical protein DM860_006956 [Cuscuta australis]|uniref:Uncharacterized protein n=1 Tax=Cuscuta australis TaxID=267555 RepID=A0A328E5I4_9ASTE|nr:hypothetical protein DM860_006956 [Cuscuta australis]